jgi:hypothetical protein
VRTAEFSQSEIDDGPKTALPPLWRRYLPHAVAALLGVIFLAALVLVWRRGSRHAKHKGALGLPPGAMPMALPGPDRTHLLADPVSDAPQFRDRALELAAKDPATAAVVLRQWLNAPSPTTSARS